MRPLGGDRSNIPANIRANIPERPRFPGRICPSLSCPEPFYTGASAKATILFSVVDAPGGGTGTGDAAPGHETETQPRHRWRQIV
jgi:hypothetical protein